MKENDLDTWNQHEYRRGVAGQQYGHPKQAVLAGADCLIVGSGIHKSNNPIEAAKEYARVSWNALQMR